MKLDFGGLQAIAYFDYVHAGWRKRGIRTIYSKKIGENSDQAAVFSQKPVKTAFAIRFCPTKTPICAVFLRKTSGFTRFTGPFQATNAINSGYVTVLSVTTERGH
ncbi:hypothetical protein [Thiobacillus denitrificans]|uniref:hypothetical protein n=1 Tax=Thiobacillus denitrificans TaxID=36861 RepID=UPI0014615595|nr:hypothetical protein [Thiobacillus denitrificans]